MSEESTTNRHDELGRQQKTLTFLGDQLTLVEEPFNQWSISIKSVCKALDLNLKGQIQRIKQSPDLTRYLNYPVLQTSGGPQNVACMNVEGISEWFAGLRLRQSNQEMHAKIRTYQDMLPRVLRGEVSVEEVNISVEEISVSEPIIVTAEIVEDSDEERNEQEDSSLVMPEPSTISIQFEQEENESSGDEQKKKMLTILTNLVPKTSSRISSTSSQVDRSLREASFAAEDQWEVISDTPIFSSSNQLQVYLGTPEKPLELEEAQAKIRQLGGSTILTARIVSGLWNLRRRDHRLSINGSAPIRFDEILMWKGVSKHHREIYPGVENQRTDGFRPEHKQQLIRDLALLESCCVRGHCEIMVKGKPRRLYINGPYLRHSIVTSETLWGQQEIVGFFVSPGDWITTYEAYDNTYLAEIDQRIFELNPQNEQHELRLALYLVEQWRQQAAQKLYSSPYIMRELLEASMISIDTVNVTRFATRVEHALERLWEKGILDEPAVALTPVDKSKTRWGKEWLASQWLIHPPREIVAYYDQLDQKAPPSLPNPKRQQDDQREQKK